jgi:hypothetical protein
MRRVRRLPPVYHARVICVRRGAGLTRRSGGARVDRAGGSIGDDAAVFARPREELGPTDAL